MTEIEQLIDALRRGQAADPAEHARLLAAALRDARAGTELLAELLDSAVIGLRLAALEACVGRAEPELARRIVELAADSEAVVRRRVAACLADPAFPDPVPTLRTLLGDEESSVRTAALEASVRFPELAGRILAVLRDDPSWDLRVLAAKHVARHPSPDLFPTLLRCLATDDDADVRQQVCTVLEDGMGRDWHGAGFDDASALRRAAARFKESGMRGRFPRLRAWLDQRANGLVDAEALARFGSDLTAAAAAGNLPKAFGLDEAVERVRRSLAGERRRSLVLLGESGVGKTALVQQLTHELARPENGGWRVLRVAPADFLAGTRFLGEWQTRVAELIEAVRAPRRVLLYIPNLGELAVTGATSSSDGNVARALAPHIEDGSIVVLGESTPREFEQGIGSVPSLARLFEPLLVPEASAEQTQAVLEGIRDEAGANLSGATLGRLGEIADAFLCQLRRPGNAAALLRAVLARHAAAKAEITARDCLDALSRSTGVPADLLDDTVPLEVAAVRQHFESRILGQTDAVDAVVDLVTLVKAGLADPDKPLGVLLFVGPTGVGKTELARALAEYLFGDATRLCRYDMSEFATPESFQRLIGSRGSNGLLTDAVRQQPFSVVLLDEIEKSHLNVFDLCLQLFDAGRLTDGLGRTVDFRRTIIILTSNIGAQAPGSELGFGAGRATEEPRVDPERTWRELARFFRPEFLNRIDRIVNFRPLSLEATERIARREVERVLGRSGIARRHLTVNLDASVTSLLVREGWSPHFGARPLKRTVERLLLLPLARMLAGAAGRVDGVVSLKARDGAIETHWQPAPRPEPAVPATPAPPRKTAARAATRRAGELAEAWEALAPGLARFRARRTGLVEATQQRGFFEKSEERARVLDELHGIDQFLALAESARQRLDRLRADAPAAGTRDEVGVEDRTAGLAADLGHLAFVATSGDPRGLGDALVVLTRIDRRDGMLEGVPQLARMLREFARRHRMTAEFAAERFDGTTDAAYLEVAGLGAFGLLAPEAGLHRLARRERRPNPRNGRERLEESEDTVRIEVLPGAGEPARGFAKSARLRWRELKPAKERLLGELSWEVSAFDAGHVRGLEVWTAGTRAAASERILRVLHTLVSAPAAAEATEVVRTYELGIGSRIRDHRTGRATPRLGPVFKGQLELLR